MFFCTADNQDIALFFPKELFRSFYAVLKVTVGFPMPRELRRAQNERSFSKGDLPAILKYTGCSMPRNP
jgi:hypothetical protein